jgi:hypothetical protein
MPPLPNVDGHPWQIIALDAGREWWRDHPGAPLLEYATWIATEYEPMVLRNINGARHARQLSRQQREILDDVHHGMSEAAEDELRRRPREESLDHGAAQIASRLSAAWIILRAG